MSNLLPTPYYIPLVEQTKGVVRLNIGHLLLFLAMHIPLAIIMVQLPQVATLHALFAFGVGTIWALSAQRADRVIYAGAYIVGAEVLWRMTNAGVFWEFGKYALSFIFIVYIVRSRKFSPPPSIVLFFVLLLPSLIVLPFETISLGEIRDQISFNLSGPFALMLSVLLFSQIILTYKQIYLLAFAVIGPTLSIAIVSIINLSRLPFIEFTYESNKLLSSFASPNQIASALGLGAFLAFLCLILIRENRSIILNLVLISLIIGFLIVSMISFSR